MARAQARVIVFTLNSRQSPISFLLFTTPQSANWKEESARGVDQHIMKVAGSRGHKALVKLVKAACGKGCQ